MPELTDILRQRLGSEGDPKIHPDADTLTAYAEELLPAAERREVLLHISLCNQCRDVVALTMPERAVAAEEPEITIAAPTVPGPRRAWRWFLTPRFGLVASLVAVAVGVTLLLEIPQQDRRPVVTTTSVQQRQEAPRTFQPPTQDSYASRLASPAQPSATPNIPAARLSAAETNRFSAAESKPQMVAAAPARKATMTGQNQPVAVAGILPQDYINNQVFAKQLFAADTVSSPAVQELPSAPRPPRPTFALGQWGNMNGSPQSSAFLELAPSGGAGSGQSTIVIYGSERQGFSVTSKITQIGRGLHLKRLSPAISTANANSYAMFSPGLAESRTAEITPQALESGPTGAALAQSPAFTSRGMRGSLSALDHGTTFLWKVVQGRLLKSSDMEHWTDGYPAAEGVEFSVVTARGADVWAGGKDAALVHSRDGGLTWERITLGASATGDINSIEVAGPNIRVRSSSGQGWLSRDGGRSWILPPQ